MYGDEEESRVIGIVIAGFWDNNSANRGHKYEKVDQLREER